jgi:hypothetical protein
LKEVIKMAVDAISSSAGQNVADIRNQKQTQTGQEDTQVSKTSAGQTAVAADTTATKVVSSGEGNTLVETSQYGDTVEISEAGLAKAQGGSSGSARQAGGAKPSGGAGPSGGGTAGAASSGKASSAASGTSASSTSASSEEEETESTSDLSQYSEYELMQMLANGKISRAQYEAELTNRGKGTEEAEAGTVESSEKTGSEKTEPVQAETIL